MVNSPAPAADIDQLSSVNDNPVVEAPPMVMFLAVASVPMRMFPVFVSPKVSVCLLVVARVPEAERYAPPVVAVPAETEAVGVPEFMFKTANFAEVEDCPPMAKSTVELFG